MVRYDCYAITHHKRGFCTIILNTIINYFKKSTEPKPQQLQGMHQDFPQQLRI